jgi:hypothetical protein
MKTDVFKMVRRMLIPKHIPSYQHDRYMDMQDAKGTTKTFVGYDVNEEYNFLAQDKFKESE